MVLPARGEETSAEADTTGCSFNARRLIVPGALIGIGALGVSIGPFVKARKWVNKEVGYHNMHRVDDYLQYVPLAAYLGLEYCGLKAQRPIVDRTLTAATGFVLMSAVTFGAKKSVRAERPDGSDLSSFPSGHAARAFLGAELIRSDYGTWPGVGAYVVATGVSAMRLAGQRHWVNDLLAGAGIGVLSARAALWLLPLERRWFGLERHRTQALIAPAYEPATRSVALAATFIF